MGFFSKLKKNMTGDWATISLQARPASRGSSAVAVIDIAVKDEPISIDRVYAKIKCVEEIRIDNYRLSGVRSGDNASGPSSVDVRHTETVYEQELNVTGAKNLDAMSSHQLEADFPLPGNLPPTFTGSNVRIIYKVMAGIDMKGNDPNTKWTEIVVN